MPFARFTNGIFASFLLSSTPATAGDINTALTPAEVTKIVYTNCAGEMNYARQQVPQDEIWSQMIAEAKNVLVANMPSLKIRSLIDQAEKQVAGGTRQRRELGSFQICLLDNKIVYAEARAKRAGP